MKFLILQYWADVIMYNSYMKQIKYLQGLNLGAHKSQILSFLGFELFMRNF